jgi:hyaluronoglucosaminidase
VGLCLASGLLLGPPVDARQHGGGAPLLYPVPQSVKLGQGVVSIPGRVTIVSDSSTDGPTLSVVRRALRHAGARTFVEAPASASKGPRLTVYIAQARLVERGLRIAGSRGLAPGGYVLAAGHVTPSRPVIVLDGVDPDGQYHAAQTLRQLLSHHHAIRTTTIRDWPSLSMRGVVEGFYGTPWSMQARLSMLDFLGAHKLNLYIWTPKDDPSLRARWRTPFPADRLSMIHALVERAARNHVTFAVGVSPGLSVCYSSTADERRLIAKLKAAWSQGVRAFAVAFDDIDPNRVLCASDRKSFGTGPTALAAGQAHLLNQVRRDFIATHDDPLPLIAVPTEYKGLNPTPYRTTLAHRLDPEVVVQWTGLFGISLSVSGTEAQAARRLYLHPVLLWDNAFVNDFAPGSLILGAHKASDARLTGATLGTTADPMGEAEASKIGLFTLADETWNLRAYDAASSWEASITEFAGNIDVAALSALRTFADVNAESPVSLTQSPELSAAISSFWTDWNAGDATAADRLKPTLERLRDAPTTLRRTLRNAAFLAEASPWLDATEAWAESSLAAVQLLVDRRLDHPSEAATDEATARALRSKALSFMAPGPTDPSAVKVAPGVFDRFVHQALRGWGP